ncbi:MAG: SRPBCC domain-containing protein [Deferribacteres bacterium]|nr:SRPBCC domain-containing protein [candidate division KSB1 bacterium]MCB9509623.1 SRPBCC domain-containing protein [Deferribacteres bacterium]
MQNSAQALPAVNAKRILVNISIQANCERVWQALISEIHQWWPKDFFVYQNAKIKLEPWPGGRLYEDSGTGAGGLWYTVMNILPPAVLELAGHLAPQWGGPATSIVRFTLSESNGKTEVEIDDALFGCLKPDAEKQISEGWRLLIEAGLKQHIESNPAATI